VVVWAIRHGGYRVGTGCAGPLTRLLPVSRAARAAPRPGRGVDMSNKREALTKSRIENATVPLGARQKMLWDTVVSGLACAACRAAARPLYFAIGRAAGGAAPTRAS